MNSLEKKLKDSAFVIGTNTSSCWVVRLSRVNEELGVVAQQIREVLEESDDWSKLAKRFKFDFTPDYLTAHKVSKALLIWFLGLLVEEEKVRKYEV